MSSITSFFTLFFLLLLLSKTIQPFSYSSNSSFSTNSSSYFYNATSSSDGISSYNTSSSNTNVNSSWFSFTSDTANNDQSVMHDFRDVIYGNTHPNPNLNWNTDSDYCSWTGIKCDVSQRVIIINISSHSLSGNLPNLTSLSQLTYISLQNNSFYGPIDVLASLPNLSEVYLSSNNFTGVVPSSFVILPELTHVYLDNNKFQGPLPQFPSTVTKSLANNNFCRNTSGDCDPQVTTLLQIAADLGFPLELAEAWVGNDACNRWDFVTCDSGMHIVVVNFSRQGFSGIISAAFADLKYLKELYLNDNHLTGHVPDSLTDLASLTKLDLSNNNLTGQVPKFRSTVDVLTAGNQFDSEVSDNRSRMSTKIKILLGIGCTIVLLVAFVSIVLIACKMHRKKHDKSSVYNVPETELGVNSVQSTEHRDIVAAPEQIDNVSLELSTGAPKNFRYQDLVIATNNFDTQNVIGKGGFGEVYKGDIRNRTVAVKLLKKDTSASVKTFEAEVRTLGQTSHINLVKLVGYCSESSHYLIVYEYINNGSLAEWIFDSEKRRGYLSWDQKKNIILQIAKGLHYLHKECSRKILHRDVKPQNVLLDEKFNAKLADFGLAKLLHSDHSDTTTHGKGTRGYIAPENIDETKINEKVDVYSYGVVILEVISGRKNCSDEESLVSVVKTKVEENQIVDLFDNWGVDMQENAQEKEKILKLAVKCLNTNPEDRPNISHVLKIIEDND